MKIVILGVFAAAEAFQRSYRPLCVKVSTSFLDKKSCMSGHFVSKESSSGDDEMGDEMGVFPYEDLFGSRKREALIEKLEEDMKVKENSSELEDSGGTFIIAPPMEPVPTSFTQFDEDNAMDGDSEEYPDNSQDNDVVRFLKESFIPNKYDGKRKRQAKYVARNIVGISLAIGIIFTAIWYAFPGKFISYGGDPNFTGYGGPGQLYEQPQLQPENLLSDPFSGGPRIEFDPTVETDKTTGMRF